MVNNFKRLFYHYFLPHESNNYKARALHHTSLIFYLVLLFTFQMLFGMVKWVKPEILGYATDISVEKILYLINQKRAEANISPLNLSTELSSAATKKATDMFSSNYWAHVSPTGVTPWSFITSAGYEYLYAGENLAKNFDYSQEVVEAWMNSPTHRANILKPEYTDIGLSVMNGRLNGEETTLVVQEFGAKALQVNNNQKKQITDRGVSSTSPQIGNEGVKVKSELSSAGVVKPKGIFIPSSISKTLSLVLTEFLLIILFLDSLFMWKNKTMRVAGHSLAHLIFLGALIGAMGATGIGVIL